MARSLRFRVIAAGVKTGDELNFLQKHHCDEAQGYYFSKPVTAQKFAAMLRSNLRSEGRVSQRA